MIQFIRQIIKSALGVLKPILRSTAVLILGLKPVSYSVGLLHRTTSWAISSKPVRFSLELLQPEFCWTPRKRQTLSPSFPLVPRPASWLIRRFWGYAHKALKQFSYRYYCRWIGYEFNNQIIPLPFGILLKWSDGTRLEDCLSTQAMRDAGLPVPYILCYGEHADCSHAPFSMLMFRMPGVELYQELWDWFEPHQKVSIISELMTYMDAIRAWRRTSDGDKKEDKCICSIMGTSIRSLRVPRKLIGPCCDQETFDKKLIFPASMSHVKLFANYERDIARTASFHEMKHTIVFSHGDFNPWNILVTYDGHLSAILDWESAGWYPEYWDFTTTLMWQRPGTFWFEIVMALMEGKYSEELEGDLALHDLTRDSRGW